MTRRQAKSLTLLPPLLALAALLPGCRSDGEGPAVEPSPGAPVILISIDTLRSDRLPAYGHRAVQTPAIDALRRDGILFERAYSQYPLTLPSHSTMLTGLLPTHHGVRDNMGYDLDTENLPFLPVLLKQRGYATGGVVSSFVLRGDVGLSTGFDLYDDAIEAVDTLFLGNIQRSGEESLGVAEGWLEELEPGAPFFLFFHMYEPHSPYEAPEPFRSRYGDPYDAEVAAADAVVGKLLEILRRKGLYDRSLIVLLSDHGEGLGDHGEQEHGILLYREALQVPLIVKLPEGKLAGRSVPGVASLVDVVPTVLEVLGAEPPQELDGRSLLELLDPAAPPRSSYAETFYSRLHMGWSELESLIAGDHHFIRGPNPELFDVVADPREQRNVMREERRALAELRDALEAMLVPLAPPGEVDPQTRDQLAALGYLGGTVQEREGPRPDPRSHIPVLRQVGEGHKLLSQERYAEAAEVLSAVVADYPEMQDAWVSLGMCLAEVGRLGEAIGAYRKAVEISGPLPQLTTRLASLHLQLGRLKEAEQYARLGLEANATWGHSKLAEVALARDDVATAEVEARAAVAERGKQVLPLILLTRVLLRKGALAEAGEALATIERETAERKSQKPLPGIHFLRGDLAAREGRFDEARRELEREIELYPDFIDAYARLAFLYAVEGDSRRTAEILRRMVERDGGGSAAAYALAVQTLRGLGDPRSAAGLLAVARSRFPDSDQLAALGAS